MEARVRPQLQATSGTAPGPLTAPNAHARCLRTLVLGAANLARTPAVLCFFVAPILVFFFSACGTTNNQLLVFAAASLREALVPMAVEFERGTGIPVQLHFNGSVTLSQQLLKGAPGDIFIAAGAGPMNRLQQKGLLSSGDRTILLTNQLVLIVPINADLKLPSLSETLVVSNRIAIADPKLAPAGQYTRETLEHLSLWEDLTHKMLFAPDVRAALA